MRTLAVSKAPPCLEGTLLEGISLETILRNVDNNNCWKRPEEIAVIRREAENAYRAYVSLRNGKPVASVACDASLGRSILFYWKQGKFFPEILKEHRQSLLPADSSERIAYAYLLGVYGHNSHPLRAKDSRLERTVSSEAAALKIENAGKIFGMKPRRKGEKICIQNKMFIRALAYCLKEKFDNYVNTDSERIAYLQGYIDASKIKVHKDEGRLRYVLALAEPSTRMNIIKSLFELGIYSSLKNGNQAVQVTEVSNLRRLYDLKLDQNEDNRQVVAGFLAKRAGREDMVETYYTVRRMVQQSFEKREIPRWKDLTERFKISYDASRQWTANIAAEHISKARYRHRKPKVVKRYEALLDLLSLPNVYTASGPTERNGKIFFPVEGEVCCLPLEVQRRYLSSIGRRGDNLDEQDIISLHKEIRAALNKEKGKNFDVIIGPGRVVKEINLSDEPMEGKNIPFAAGNTIYLFTPRAQRDFFVEYGLPPEEITPEHIAFIKDELKAYLADDRTSDIYFKIRETTITRLFVRENPKGGNRCITNILP